MMRIIGLSPEELGERKTKRAKGCKRCHNTGFRGRLGIFEMLTMNNEIRELAFNRAATQHIRKAARASGMRSLLEDGKIKIMRGTTTPLEIGRIAASEGIITGDE